MLLTLLVLALAVVLNHLEVAPRSLGPYLERRSLGHNPLIEDFGSWSKRALVSLDRGEQLPFALPPLKLGAQAVPAQTGNARLPRDGAAGQVVFVDSAVAARNAIQAASPGDVITFLPGRYFFNGRSVDATRPGNATGAITVRAQQPGTVTLLFDLTEGFRVSAPYWIFENLAIKGVCPEHTNCEHAFHVTTQAAYFMARNNVITDFNAHFKVNGDGTHYPDHGIIEANTLSNTSVRQTANPVTPIDIVGANDWIIRGNLISDFVKGDGNRVSYGAFAKGAGRGNRFERNIVLCERALRGAPGQRVGLSLGGGGTGSMYCRDRKCLTEQDGGSIEANLIAFCSDDGIYLNRAAASRVAHNTLIDTAGITVGFAVSSADIEGNLLDSIIRSRDDGVIRATDNVTSALLRNYAGWHAVRDLFVQPAMFDFAWRAAPPLRKAGSVPPLGLCGDLRNTPSVYGAFDDFSACLAIPGPAGSHPVAVAGPR
ncbi:right-handed parallel beta-helix repeat-containing protein [Janthinobacterium sp. 17J80-10]|uniref:right-handed parallel beta-helix repeat-containing protein n=1 Tax=Janthinobacterium sp. 17J80-10 TaxID=2497863 RepID=UPI001F50F27B|nr:right-handed parallel beta-helix repeat-containing protein [Janthinobacterium sp. 17J80-10]